MKYFAIPLILLFLSCNQADPKELITVPVPETGITFPVGTGDRGSATIDKMYALGETEVTNELAAEILQWALESGYFTTETGKHNSIDADSVRYGGQELLDLDDYGNFCKIDFTGEAFTVEKGTEKLPVVRISWYGAALLCNWLTEMEDGDTANIVYAGFDESTVQKDIIADYSRSGYRIPTREEWELAARWAGTDPAGRTDLVSRGKNNGDVALTEGYYFTPGDYASGALANVNNEEACLPLAVFDENSSGSYPMDASEVASKGPDSVNQLGLYDMSGNAREWTFNYFGDGQPSRPYFMGGSWSSPAMYLKIGGIDYPHNPWFEYDDITFRLCRTVLP